jgi:hypothetical protein
MQTSRRDPSIVLSAALDFFFQVIFLPLIIAILCVLALLAGCTVGPSFTVSPDGRIVSDSAPAPNRVTLTENGKTWATESAVPASYTEMFDRNNNSVAAVGPRSRLMILPWFGEEMKLASDTDITISVADASMPDGTLLKGLTFTTLSSPVIKAQNDVWDKLAPIIINRDTEQARVFLANASLVESAVSALGPGILDVLRAIAAP